MIVLNDETLDEVTEREYAKKLGNGEVSKKGSEATSETRKTWISRVLEAK